MSNQTVIAWVDIRPSLVVAAVVLIAGASVVALMSRHRKTNGGQSRLWIPLASLGAGPIIAFSWWVADVFVLNPRHVSNTVSGRCAGDADGYDRLGDRRECCGSDRFLLLPERTTSRKV